MIICVAGLSTSVYPFLDDKICARTDEMRDSLLGCLNKLRRSIHDPRTMHEDGCDMKAVAAIENIAGLMYKSTSADDGDYSDETDEDFETDED